MPKDIHNQTAYFPTLSPDLTDKERRDAGLEPTSTPAYMRLTALRSQPGAAKNDRTKYVVYTDPDGHEWEPIGKKALQAEIGVDETTISRALRRDGTLKNGGKVREVGR